MLGLNPGNGIGNCVKFLGVEVDDRVDQEVRELLYFIGHAAWPPV
jgi:hypothetical protein